MGDAYNTRYYTNDCICQGEGEVKTKIKMYLHASSRVTKSSALIQACFNCVIGGVYILVGKGAATVRLTVEYI